MDIKKLFTDIKYTFMSLEDVQHIVDFQELQQNKLLLNDCEVY